MSVKVKYKGNEILTSDTDESRKLLTSGKYLEGDVIIENKQDGGSAKGVIWEEVDEEGFPIVVDATNCNTNFDYTYCLCAGGSTPVTDMPYRKLQTLKLAVGTKRFGSQMCYSCGELKNLIVDTSSLISIGASALGNCLGLTKLDITSQTMTTIENNALYASGIDTLVIRRTDRVVTLGGIRGINSNPIMNKTGRIYVPDNLVAEYKSSPNWLSLDDSIIVPLSTLEE